MSRFDFYCPSCRTTEERAVPVTRHGEIEEQECAGCHGKMVRRLPSSFTFLIEGGGAAVEAAGRNVPRRLKIKRQIARRRYKDA